MNALIKLLIRWAWPISIVGTLIAFVGAYYTVELYKNLRPDVEELLPTTARSVVDLGEVQSRLESIDNLVVLIFSDDPAASKRFVIDLAQKLESVPRSIIAGVEYRIDRELKFFNDRRGLYIELQDLEKIRDYVRDRIDYEKGLYNPLNIVSGAELKQPELDFRALLAKYNKRASVFSRFPDGFYASPDQKIRVLIADMPGKGGIIGAQKLKAEILKAVGSLDPKKYGKNLEVKYTGNIQNLIEENAALLADLELSTIIVVIAVACMMLIFYRAFWAPMALMASLFMGTFWTFGVSYFLVGYLNANSAFLASIVIGNGINFGIILLARYMEERRNGFRNHRAIWKSVQGTATSTGTAALGAGMAYGSLMLTGFRGFNQFGVIGLVGMILCWLSAYILLPAYLTTLDQMLDLTPRLKKPKTYFSDAIAWLVGGFSKPIWYVSVVLGGVSLVILLSYRGQILETDMNKLRDKESMEHGSGALYHYINDIFQRYLSPMVVLPRDREDVPKLVARFKEKMKREGDKSLIANVQTIDDFVPPHQAEKIALMREIRKLLPPRLLMRLEPSDQRLVKEFLTDSTFQPVSLDDLPPLVLSKFTEKDKSVGKLVLIDKKLTEGADDAFELIRFVRELRQVADSVKAGTPVAGQLPISADMIEAITHDGPRATLFAFLAVLLLIIILFRNFHTIMLCLTALLLGVLWLTGLVLGFDVKINFLNFIALPITFGIGIDYGVNMFQRYREEGPGSIVKVVHNPGGAVCLASATTIVGYGSLLIAGNQAFVSFGLLAVLGELTCVTAAVFALPSYLNLKDRQRAAASTSAPASRSLK